MAYSSDGAACLLAQNLIRFDTRSSKTNLPLIEFIEGELRDWNVERVAYRDADGIEKAALVARRGPEEGPAIALSGHLDTVPPVGWQRDPFTPRIEKGRLYGLGSVDMKGPVAAAIVAASTLPEQIPVMLLLTTDEETTKEGARRIVAESASMAKSPPAVVVVVEPTGLRCVRGHRVDIQFIADATGIQAHSSTPDGRNANIALIPFLSDMRELHLKLRHDTSLHDPAYQPPWCDLNIVVDNYGAATNLTVGRATCRMKLRYSKSIDPDWIVAAVENSSRRNCLDLTIRPEGTPPELPVDHPLVEQAASLTGLPPLVVGFGTDASQFSAIAPCIVFGPGSIEQAHKPDEYIDVGELERSVSLLRNLVVRHSCAIASGIGIR